MHSIKIKYTDSYRRQLFLPHYKKLNFKEIIFRFSQVELQHLY